MCVSYRYPLSDDQREINHALFGGSVLNKVTLGANRGLFTFIPDDCADDDDASIVYGSGVTTAVSLSPFTVEFEPNLTTIAI